jgi:hypothetical protein
LQFNQRSLACVPFIRLGLGQAQEPRHRVGHLRQHAFEFGEVGDHVDPTDADARHAAEINLLRQLVQIVSRRQDDPGVVDQIGILAASEPSARYLLRLESVIAKPLEYGRRHFLRQPLDADEDDALLAVLLSPELDLAREVVCAGSRIRNRLLAGETEPLEQRSEHEEPEE